MIFSSPSFLWALGLLAIPIIIHLFQFRRFRKILFPDISLLKEVQTKSQIKNRLRHWIILISRLAFLSLLVLAFAEPRIEATTQASDTPNLVGIYIDNSLSMQNRSQDANLLDLARQDAFEIIEAYPNETRFQLITNKFSSAERRTYDKASFISLLDIVSFSPLHRNFDDVIRFHNTIDDRLTSAPSVVYYLSDFSQSLDSIQKTTDSTISVRMIKYAGLTDQNISIDSVWVETPLVRSKEEVKLHFTATNYSSEYRPEIPIHLDINGNSSQSIRLSFEPGGYIDTSFVFLTPDSENIINGKISAEDLPVVYDNSLYFTIQPTNKTAVGIINSTGDINNSLKKLFSTDEFSFMSSTFSEFSLGSMNDLDLIVLNQLQSINSGISSIIRDLTGEGKNAFLILPSDLSASQQKLLEDEYNFSLKWDTSQLEVNSLRLDDPLFEGVFESQPKNLNYPKVSGHWAIDGPQVETIIELFNSDPLLFGLSLGTGRLFVLTTPLETEFTNFHEHALFVPTVTNMAIFAGGKPTLSHFIGTQRINLASKLEERTQMISDDSKAAFYPQIVYKGIILNDQIERPGFYTLKNDSIEYGRLAFNYARTESDIISPSESEIMVKMENFNGQVSFYDSEEIDLSNEISQADFGTDLWPIFLAFAMMFLIAESILTKLLRS